MKFKNSKRASVLFLMFGITVSSLLSQLPIFVEGAPQLQPQKLQLQLRGQEHNQDQELEQSPDSDSKANTKEEDSDESIELTGLFNSLKYPSKVYTEDDARFLSAIEKFNLDEDHTENINNDNHFDADDFWDFDSSENKNDYFIWKLDSDTETKSTVSPSLDDFDFNTWYFNRIYGRSYGGLSSNSGFSGDSYKPNNIAFPSSNPVGGSGSSSGSGYRYDYGYGSGSGYGSSSGSGLSSSTVVRVWIKVAFVLVIIPIAICIRCCIACKTKRRADIISIIEQQQRIIESARAAGGGGDCTDAHVSLISSTTPTPTPTHVSANMNKKFQDPPPNPYEDGLPTYSEAMGIKTV